MTTAGDIVSRINDMGDVDNVLYDTMLFFRQLPDDLDLASASYYLNKEFERNDTGVDDRVEIYTGEPQAYYDDSGESWYDSSGYDQDDYDDEVEY